MLDTRFLIPSLGGILLLPSAGLRDLATRRSADMFLAIRYSVVSL